MSNSFKVDVSPEMTMYKWLQNQPYSVHSALSEFVDNSVQSYIDNRKSIQVIEKKNIKLKIKISIDSKKKEIIILDNASGINRKNFQKAIKMGVSVNHKKSSLSKFGIGMKTSAVWFSSNWEIETSSLNSKEKLIFQFNLDELLEQNKTAVSVSSKIEKQKNHYTKIIIKNSKRIESKEYYQDMVIPHLAETFIKFKNFLSIDVEYDNEILPKKWKKKTKAYFEPSETLNYPLVNNKMESISKTRLWKKKIELDYKGSKVKGFCVIMKKGGYEQPGIRLFRNNRVIEGTLITPNRPKILSGTKNKYASERIYGELHLDDFEIDFMKTKFTDIHDLYIILKKELQKDKFIDQVNNYRSKQDKKSNKDTPSVMSVISNKNIIVRSEKGQEERKKATSLSSTKILLVNNISDKLENLTHKKLYYLYNSLCKISLVEHPYLAYIGGWAFLDCLSCYMGKPRSTSFKSFYDSKINDWYNKNKRNGFKNVINEIASRGNISKHDSFYELEDAKQLNKDFKTLEDFIIKCIDEIAE